MAPPGNGPNAETPPAQRGKSGQKAAGVSRHGPRAEARENAPIAPLRHHWIGHHRITGSVITALAALGACRRSACAGSLPGMAAGSWGWGGGGPPPGMTGITTTMSATRQKFIHFYPLLSTYPRREGYNRDNAVAGGSDCAATKTRPKERKRGLKSLSPFYPLIR